MSRTFNLLLVFATAALVTAAAAARPDSPKLTIVVMDPLAAPLSCPCVKGYAQRDYDQLGKHLEGKLSRPVAVAYSDSLTKALKEKTEGKADLIIGKRSVVLSDCKTNKLAVTPVAALTGKDGLTTMNGLVVVPKADPAKTVADLKGYRIIFGTPDCDEKYSAPLDLLKHHRVTLPAKLETNASCADGATMILELGENVRGAAVISSYAAPLLEGCGTIQKGDLRVVGTTLPVPFVVAFTADSLPQKDRAAIADALLKVVEHPPLLVALETQKGFIPEPTADLPKASAEKKVAAEFDRQTEWPGWRGANRDGRAAWLPARLPDRPKTLWRTPISGKALGGVAATADCVIASGREFADTTDLFRCLRATDGTELWALRYSAPGGLDYGSSPRATPIIDGDIVFLAGAFGHLHAVELTTGKVLWHKDLKTEFQSAGRLSWGLCASPLVADNKLIVNPGGPEASLVALDPKTGEVAWKTPGFPAGYGSLIAGTFGGVRQIVGHDETTLGGWDLVTGKRLWTVEPPKKNDYNVPTPLAYNGDLIVATENNGTRRYRFGPNGIIDPKPVAEFAEANPETTSPVIVGDRLFVVGRHTLFCLDLRDGLKLVWKSEDDAFDDHVSMLASNDRLLIATLTAELILLDARAEKFQPLSRIRVLDDETGMYPHPAVASKRLYLRGGDAVYCLPLE